MQINKSSYIGGYKQNDQEITNSLPIDDKLDIEKEKEIIKEEVKIEKKQEKLLDWKLLLLFGFSLLMLALLYLYWGSFRCHVIENSECNLTMEYAIENRPGIYFG